MAAPASAPVVQRRLRRWAASEVQGNRFIQGNQFQITFTKVTYNGNEVKVANMEITNSTTPNTKFSVSLTTDKEPITFDITYSSVDGYFTLTNAKYGSTALRTPGVNAPTTFSYACGNNTWYSATVDNAVNKLSWSSLQLQAPFNAKVKDGFVFGDSWDCVGFVTPGILMGLFVLVILLVIVFLGLCWMMDIKTMDRFDDPKGKTITINASAD